MRIIVPMAGRGSRLRPHTLTTPKPLLPVAGKPIVERLVEDIAGIYGGPIDEIVFIIGDFGEKVEQQLKQVAERLGSTGTIAYQDKPLGTAHAIQCAGDALNDELIIAFADTLFRADFTLDRQKDGAIWVKEVEDPRAFGVVTVNEQGAISGMVEKPETPVSNLAIIGIYYVKDGAALKAEIQHLLDNDIKSKGEYQLTDALENLRNKGKVFVPGKVEDWMDCGNKSNLLSTNRSVLGYLHRDKKLQTPEADPANGVIIHPPCFIHPATQLADCIVGPHVSIGEGSQVKNAVVKNSIIQNYASVTNTVLEDSIVSNYAQAAPQPRVVNLGDFSAMD